MIGINLPPIGKPYTKLGIGLCGGLGEYNLIDWDLVGLRVLDKGAGGMMDLFF